ncbi:RluA family pseudouridine synthase [Acidaminobacter hydrogenoformans]|uniref:Pseudouridine synthase n=1 Tax=Acidaminobacter hydrogenoformans DSM 2784 TaxID=1120920 RepID=A0A1G5RSA7_9FIRM|nr:RluA family pseudouridine synthase [Acidaminobacter hydrogenoformans]SCZ76985.1 23S rRNA pseudouridine1911/1915/1917 synthase [Acidaminobacter hydrogenoformans DSM 2784]
MQEARVETLRFEYEDMEAERLDVYLSRMTGATSRTYLQKLIKEGQVTVNGQVVTVKKEKLKSGDIVSLALPPLEPMTLQPEAIPLDIVFEDDDLLVVNKASGMVVHPAPGSSTGTLVHALLHHCKGQLSGINGVARPGIVHRLDKDTSGLMMVAKTDRAHRALAEELKNQKSIRRYCALVVGVMKHEEGRIEGPIGRDPKNRLRMAIVEGGKPAVTHYKVLQRFRHYTLVECRLETGRTHQIRVHLRSIGHPIAGDPLYGTKTPLFPLEGQFLHARTLGLTHPVTHELMIFDSELPTRFIAALEKIERRDQSGI